MTCNSAFSPRPGTPCKAVASLDNYVAGPATTAFDPDCRYIVEFDQGQIDSCSCFYNENDQIPVIDTRKCKGAMLRNIVIKSQNAGIKRTDQLGAVLDTTGKFQVLTDAEIIAPSTLSVAGSLLTGAYAYQTGGNAGTASLLYVAGSTGKFLKNQAILAPAYYTVSPGADTEIVAVVL